MFNYGSQIHKRLHMQVPISPDNAASVFVFLKYIGRDDVLQLVGMKPF